MTQTYAKHEDLEASKKDAQTLRKIPKNDNNLVNLRQDFCKVHNLQEQQTVRFSLDFYDKDNNKIGYGNVIANLYSHDEMKRFYLPEKYKEIYHDADYMAVKVLEKEQTNEGGK